MATIVTMNGQRFLALGATILMVMLFGAFSLLAWSGRNDAAVAPLYPAGNLSTMGTGGGVQFVNGFANW